MEHFLLKCNRLMDVRSNIESLQRPHIEDTQEIMRDFLFNDEREEDAEERKEKLHCLWRIRQKRLEGT